MKELKKNIKDYQKYCEIHDKIFLYNDYSSLYINCKTCNSINHSFLNCPKTHLSINKLVLRKSKNLLETQQRKKFSRIKNKCKIYIKNIEILSSSRKSTSKHSCKEKKSFNEFASSINLSNTDLKDVKSMFYKDDDMSSCYSGSRECKTSLIKDIKQFVKEDDLSSSSISKESKSAKEEKLDFIDCSNLNEGNNDLIKYPSKNDLKTVEIVKEIENKFIEKDNQSSECEIDNESEINSNESLTNELTKKNNISMKIEDEDLKSSKIKYIPFICENCKFKKNTVNASLEIDEFWIWDNYFPIK